MLCCGGGGESVSNTDEDSKFKVLEARWVVQKEAIGEGGQVSAMLTKLESANFRNKSSLATKLLSRTGRLANLAAAPFNVTLFLDDDTFLESCGVADLIDRKSVV